MVSFIYNDRVYENLKWVTQILLPAVGTLYFALGGIWDWPNIEQVVGTVTAVVTFLGITLGISGHNYQKEAVTVSSRPDGTLNVVRQEDGTLLYDFDANDTFAELTDKDGVVFKINKDTSV